MGAALTERAVMSYQTRDPAAITHSAERARTLAFSGEPFFFINEKGVWRAKDGELHFVSTDRSDSGPWSTAAASQEAL